MTEQEAKLYAIRIVNGLIGDLMDHDTAECVKENIANSLLAAHASGVKAGEAKGGYRAGFAAGQASANKTIAELHAQVAALKATVDQCRAAGFIDDAGNVRKVLGTLPLTADGCVVGMGIHSQFRVGGLSGAVNLRLEGSTQGHGDWYSTREAAEAARKAVKP